MHECDGKYFVGVNYCAMDKYREPCSAEQWKCCVESIKVSPFMYTTCPLCCLSPAMLCSTFEKLILAPYILQELADVAADYGIEYGLEVVNRYETNICNTGVQVCTRLCGKTALYQPRA